MDDINSVEYSLPVDERRNLSELLRRLNKISQEIRHSSLERQLTFSIEPANWISDTFGPSSYDVLVPDLLGKVWMMQEYHPDRLKESIAEVRQNIYNTAAKEEQARNEQRQQREEARAEREEKFLEESIRIAEETKRDSRTMRGIAWVTIAFLPATFVSSFFGMNFFNGIAGNVPFDGARHNVWLFFAVAVPISGVVLFAFYAWDEKEVKKDKQKLRANKEKSPSIVQLKA
jgi:hypothetical protein